MGSSGPFISSSGGFLRAGRLLVFAAALIGIIFSTSLIVRINAAGATWYVDDATCPATGNGTLQTPYCKIQDAICAAMSGDLVSVAPGTYPESIRMRPNVDVVSQSGALLTTINGAGQPCTETNFCTKRTGQCSTVIFGSGHTTATLLDGFTITGGSGFVTTTPNQVAGGGIYVFSSSTISNNIIRDNFLSSSQQNFFGGGIFIASGAPVITNNIISGNRAIPGPGAGKSPTAGYGAGIYVAFYSAPVIIENLIENNDAGNPNTAISVGGGGGIAIFPGTGPDVIVDRNIIADNYAADLGGGIHIIGKNGAVANPIITNNVVVGNVCPFEGGGIYVAYIGARIVNNTIRDNAGMRGGGIQTGGGDPNLPIVITNNIIEGNRITDLGGQAGGIFAYSPLSSFLPTISETDIWGNQGAEVDGDLTEAQVIGVNGNFSADPLFADPNARDFHLDPNSPAIDVGTTSGAPAVDFDNNLRGVDGDGTPDSPQVGDIDVGAFEVQGGCSTLPEVCDNLDNNCDGTTDDFPTACGVGQCASTGTCTAGSNSCVPGTPSAEICDNLDNNCDGTTDSFATSCGIGQCARTGTCTAGSNSCAPGTPSAEICDNLDNNCDGTTDSFATSCGIGQCARTGTCTAGSNSCTPGAPAAEICDNLDNNCDGTTDAFATSCGIGQCARTGTCTAGSNSCSPGAPTAEICDNLDNNCDGTTDAFATSCGIGQCARTGTCTAGSNSCTPGAPAAEICDNLDNNCDGTTDAFATSCGIGQCARTGTCTAGSNSCSPGAPTAEICDNLDNNCDGTTDEGFPDSDGDMLNDCLDPDDDNDGAADAGDCAPLNAGSFGFPTEVLNLSPAAGPPTTLSWTVQNIGAATTYEIHSGLLSRMKITESLGESFCLSASSPTSPFTDTRGNPPPGDGYLYLIRSFNACGAATFGDPNRDLPRSLNACSGGIVDGDADGSPSDLDCNDANPGISPLATELCDNVDNNCDATTDSFATTCGLGQCVAAGTCTAGSDSCTPGAPSVEICDNMDNNCDGTTDVFATTCGVGECVASGTCVRGLNMCAPGTPAAELCDGLDNSCDAVTDEGFGVGTTCDGVGTCGVGVRECAGTGGTRCSTEPGGSADQSVPEVCDNLDNNCDGTTDSFATSCGLGQCARTGTCTAGSNSCAPGAPSTEVCDGLDNDCDGATDDGVLNACGACGALAPDASCNGVDDNCNGVTDEACCTAVSATLSQHEAAGRAHVVNESCGTTPVQVFADNFESGNLSQWSPLIGAPTVTSTPTDVISGTFSAWFSSVGAEGVRKTVNTSGLTNVTLSYKRRSRSMEATDSFTVRWSTNGGSSWTNLEVVTGTYGITTRSFALPAASSLLLSFEATLSSATGDHAFLDDVVVSGDMPCVQPTWYATGSNQLLGTNPAMTVVLNERPIGSGMWRTGGCPTCLGEDLTCDGVDDDCNGVPDDAFDVGTACDGVGACGAGVRECSSPAASRCSTDPGGTQDQSIPETCDAVDNDCDGVADDGFTDSDLDGQADCTDPDDDNDGAIDVIDCAPLNATAFAQPTAVADVMATGQGPTNLTWMTQSAGSGTLYDVTTGDFAAIGGISYPAGSCLASTTSGFTTDAGPNPALGSVTYYLVRARNVCGISSYGSAGRDTSPSCP